MDRNCNVDPRPAELQFLVVLPWYKEKRLVLISMVGVAFALFFAGLAFNRHRQLLRSYAEVEQKVAERTRELEIASRELLHSQKMNALGTLAAGIAHDFNNILSIVKGSAQIIEDNLENPQKVRTRIDQALRRRRQRVDHGPVALLSVAEAALRPAPLAARDLAGFDRPLGQQPGDDVHDARRHLQGFAGEADAGERLEHRPLIAPGIVEIRARLVGEQHRLGVERVDESRRDAHLRFGPVRFVHHPLRLPFFSAQGNVSRIRWPLARRALSLSGTGQAMISGVLESMICWI